MEIVIDRYENVHLTDTDTDMLIVTDADTDTDMLIITDADTDMKKRNSPIPMQIPISKIIR